MPDAAIRTEGLRKVYPPPSGRKRRGPPGGPGGPPPPSGEVVALDGLDLEVRRGEFFGLLGPNGAGKTTTIGILTTRVRPTGGRAWVAGAEVSAEPVAVKRRIGVVPQRPNPDLALTVMENLVFHAAYFGIPRAEAVRRAASLLGELELGDREGAKANQLSGGQQQRLMIARALIHEPEVLFLDEPTVGLDPHARLSLWEILRRLHDEGRTIVMTTHYMEEADRLCDRLAIVDRGRLLALDTPAGLKAQAPGGTLVEVELEGAADPALEAAGSIPGLSVPEARGRVLRGYAERPGEVIGPLVRAAEHAGLAVRDVHLVPPSLESLFIALTGRKLD